MYLRIIPVLIGFLCLLNNSFATHNRAGEITYRQIGNLQIEATVTTYTRASSIQADRDTVTVCWGDGICEQVPRSNGNGDPLPNDTKVNYYTAIHTYPTFARFTISMTDPNRNAGICNVNVPGPSDNVPFHLETTVTLVSPANDGENNSPTLLYAPVDVGCVGQPFTHNPGAFDIDDDSLAFHLIIPMQAIDSQVPGYLFPNLYPSASPDNTISLNPTTGEFTWITPQAACEYNIAFYIISYRDGQPLDTMIRDMQILILECDNQPPEIETIEEICVVAGETVSFDVTATAPLSEPDQLVTLTAVGAPLQMNNSPATFPNATSFQPQPLTRTFTWNTNCQHIANQYYTVVFRATDNFPVVSQSDTSYLSAVKTVRIKVVGPPPEDVLAIAGSGQVEVSWENPYSCETAENYFQGFTVWRRQGSNLFPIDTCETGLEGRGYTKITPFPIQEIVDDRYYFLDTEVERGRTYCYRILAEFARQTNVIPPSLYNQVSSIPSEEFCVQLSRDIPLITNVSVFSTDQDTGRVRVVWTKPVVEDLDTLVNPGPYTYEVLRAEGFSNGNFQPIGLTYTSEWFATANDTSFYDPDLNTEGTPYSYQVAFYIEGDYDGGRDPFGTTNSASSPWLSIASTDETNNLSWEADVPWDNYQHIVYIFNNNTLDWDSIATTTEPAYSHTGLVNGQKYCYRVLTIGSYGIEGIKEPLLNYSQRNCGIPLDTIPPCPPQLEVQDLCATAGNLTPGDQFINDLTWINPEDICAETDDVVGYNVYFTPIQGGDFQLIASIEHFNETTLQHKPDFGIAGCYAVTAVDSFFNESAYSNIVCIDNCPIYELPNVFTPNGDGANELFIPFPYRFVDRIDMQIFNRWGQLVYETNNPDISWNGTNLSGNNLSEGTYFYVCRVFEARLSGTQQREDILRGYIELIR